MKLAVKAQQANWVPLMLAMGLPEPVKEYRFHDKRKWRFDYAWPKQLVALEIEGGTWAGGRHTRGKGYEDDCRKYNEAAILGWAVIRATTDMMESAEGVAMLERALRARQDT